MLLVDQVQIGLFYTNILNQHAINREGFMSTFKVLGRNDKGRIIKSGRQLQKPRFERDILCSV